MTRAFAALAALLLASASPAPPPVDAGLVAGDTLPPRLSDFRFFVGDRPNARVVAYSLNTPLFSDYADKDRFAFVPAGAKVTFDADGQPQFPVGSALIKTFRYGARKLETRLLLHRAGGWVALPYVWDGDDAMLKRAGTRLDATVRGQAISYAVPNVNQCKECHGVAGANAPIGPKARNLPPAVLALWRRSGITDALPAGEQLPRWDDPVAPLALRARAYLDVNCSHCHNAKGSASNTGLFLAWDERDPTALGVAKHPVAAGRGAGDRLVAIDPGHPERSIIPWRMASTEPGVAMPEVGRATVHQEGLALVSAWIAEMQ